MTETTLRRLPGHSTDETTLLWWIDTFTMKRGYYRWSICGRLDETAYPDWRSACGDTFHWSVPNLRSAGGRYVFALRPVAV